MSDNDGRKPWGYLPELIFQEVTDPVVQVIREEDGEIIYTRRIQGSRFRPPVFGPGTYTVRVGADRPTKAVARGLPASQGVQTPMQISF
jgi:hypothetical protein